MKGEKKLFEIIVDDFYCRQKWFGDEIQHGCSDYIKKGEFNHPTKKKFSLGIENKLDGLLLITDGKNIKEQMLEDEVIQPQNMKPERIAKNDVEFGQILREIAQEDGGIIYNSINRKIQNIGLIQDDPQNVETKNRSILSRINLKLKDIVPENFEYEGAKKISISGRSNSALRVTKAYHDVDVYLLREAAYTSLGIGLLSHFKNGKLIETFHIMPIKEIPEYEEDMRVPIIDEKHNATGCYRRYVDEQERVLKNEKGLIEPYFTVICDRYLRDINNISVYSYSLDNKNKKEGLTPISYLGPKNKNTIFKSGIVDAIATTFSKFPMR